MTERTGACDNEARSGSVLTQSFEAHIARRGSSPRMASRVRIVNKRLEFSIQRMKVRWNMISEVHLDQYPVKPADRRHLFLFLGFTNNTLSPNLVPGLS